jgi:hypothetical protein
MDPALASGSWSHKSPELLPEAKAAGIG